MKDVWGNVVALATVVEELEAVEEAPRVVETTGEEISSQMSYRIVFDAAIMEAKVEEEFGE